MIVEAQVDIAASKEATWAVITDIEHAATTLSGVEKIEVLERPESGFVGFKWRETRTLMGKTATEVIWITDAVANEFYKTRAESHGCAYISTVRISERDGGCTLQQTHASQPLSLMSKIMMVPMGLLCKGMMRKAISRDLSDIKVALEQRGA